MTQLSEEVEAQKVRLRKNGDLYLRADGKDNIVAHYDEKTGELEFVTKEASVKYYQRCTDRLGTTGDGKEVSNRVIRIVTVKGEPKTDLKTVPKRPKLGEQGDAAYEFVKWCLDYAPAEFVARYGPYRDENGDYVKRSASRTVEYPVDLRATHDTAELEWVKDGIGAKSQTKSLVTREREIISNPHAIMARRGTHQGPNGEPPITFTPQEARWTPDDDFEPVAQEEASE